MWVASRFQPSCGGPAFTVDERGYIDVYKHGTIKRKWPAGVDSWRPLIHTCASRYAIPDAWVAGVMAQESGGVQRALSPVGAIGLMQIMPSTPKVSFGVSMTKEELYEPENNVDIGARLLAQLSDRFKGNIVHVAVSYNAGSPYCFSGKNCSSPGMFNFNENCGYCEQVVRGINTAIDNGYCGNGSCSSSGGWQRPLAIVAGVALPVLTAVILRRRHG